MATSGIEVDPELKEEYTLMKQHKLAEPMALLAMQLSDDMKKVIKKPDLCMETCSHAQLLEFFSDPSRKNDCYYVVYDFKNKLIVLKWAPDTAPAKKKMIYASTFAALKTTFEGAKYKEATDLDDLDIADMEKLVKY